MAKTETPAEVSERAQPRRHAQRGLSEPAHRVGQHPAAAARRSLLEGAVDTLVGRHHDLDAVAPHESGRDEAALLDDDDVIDEGVQTAEPATPAFGPPRAGASTVEAYAARGAPKVPLATLEQPSSSRLHLTPSPVPRVSLTPATGAVDISLVPGPNGSRNMPTLAAQHVLGRRQQRRPAAAVTLPPPSTTTAREPFVGTELARDVRSSKGEILLGLMIGLGLSLVLAGASQAYLREAMIADGMPAAELESITLRARPEAAPRASATLTAPSTVALGSAIPASSTAGSASSTAGSASSTAASTSSNAQSSTVRRPPEHAARGQAPRARKSSLLTTAPPSFEQDRARVADKSSSGSSAKGGDKAFESKPAPAPRTPLSPAESAGLGLDLPL